MINQPTAGLDPNCRSITRVTPDLPGIFLTEEAAKATLAEQSDGKRYRIDQRGVRANGWNMTLWVATPKQWEGAER